MYKRQGVTNRGRTQVFTYTNGAWSQKGTDFLGVYTSESLGRGVDLSEDGDHIILVTDTDGNNSSNGPRVEVYKWNASASPPAWQLKGPTLGSEVGWGDGYGGNGMGISISNDGNTIAIGIMHADIAEGGTGTDTGSVEVYHYNASNNTWGPTGSGSGTQASLTAGYKLTKVFDKAAHRFGDSVSLSGDGKRLIVAESHADYAATNGGRLYTFEYTGDEWILRDMRTTGNTLGRRIGADGRATGYIGMGGGSGQGLAISRDGSTIVGGEHGYYTNGQAYSGAVRIFNMPSNIKSIWGSNDDVNWTKITTAPTREEATSNVAGFQFGYNDEIDITNIDNPKYYKYHAIVADAFTQLKDVKLFGVRKQGSSTLHDGALTLTKNLDVPRMGPPLDADDTPRRDKLVVEYNTSINPTFDGAVRDTSGRGNDGCMKGSTSYLTSEKALDIAGTPAGAGAPTTSAYLEVGQRLPFKGNQAHTVSLWFKKDNPYESYTLFNMWKEGTNYSTAGDHSGVMVLTTGKLQFWHWGEDAIYTDPLGDASGGLRHLVAVYTGTTVANQKLYVNGIEAVLSSYASGSGSGGVNLTNAKMTIGQDYFRGNFYYQANTEFSGIKVYDTVLTAQEVKTLYAMGRCDEGHHTTTVSRSQLRMGGENLVIEPCIKGFYEEDLWTPIIAGQSAGQKTPTSSNRGWFVRVGNLVTIGGTLAWSGGDTLSGNPILAGLPYKSTSIAGGRCVLAWGVSPNGFTTPSGYTTMRMIIDPNQIFAYILASDDQNAVGYTHSVTIASAGLVYGLGGTYRI